MRRVLVSKISAGMVLARPVYDVHGLILVDAGVRLRANHRVLLNDSLSTEILVEHAESNDLLAAPLFPALLESKAIDALRTLLSRAQPAPDWAPPGSLVGAMPWLNKMLDCIHPVVLGDTYVSGCHRLDDAQYIHSVKVAQLAMLIGQLAGAERAELFNLGLTALLMNAGYEGLPAGMLASTAEWTVAERMEMTHHPVMSASMMRLSGAPADVLRAVEQHHEQWDGRGYPHGLGRHDVSLYARIVSIADVYIALRSRRPYRDAMAPHEAIEFIMAFSGALFDPELVQLFVRHIPSYPTAAMVTLSTGESGIVIDPNAGHIARPKVRVLSTNGTAMKESYAIDLSDPTHQQSVIQETEL